MGCGFTGRFLATRLRDKGVDVVATTRHPESPEMHELAGAGAKVIALEQIPEYVRPGARILHSIPIVGGDPEESIALLDLLQERPARIVYISTTGVYGGAEHVDETTPVDQSSERALARLAVEQAVAAGPWSSLMLRASAIYGPGRGVHVAYKQGRYPRHESFISRIHVADLAAHTEAALFSDVAGAFPVADEEPCTSSEIYDFCAELLGPPDVPPQPASRGPVRFSANRRVDGSAIRTLLGIELEYPTYKTGIPAAIQAMNG